MKTLRELILSLIAQKVTINEGLGTRLLFSPLPSFEHLLIIRPKIQSLNFIQNIFRKIYSSIYNFIYTSSQIVITSCTTLSEMITLKEETFAISRFLAKFAKVCSRREIFVNYKSRKFILAKKKRVLDSRKSRNLKIYIYRK